MSACNELLRFTEGEMRETNYWLRRRRLTRRRFIGTTGALGAGAAGWTLVGCGNGDDDDAGAQPTATSDSGDGGAAPTATPTTAAADFDQNGTLRIAIPSDRGSLDIQEVGGVSNYYNGELHFGRLIVPHPVTNDFVPHMAEVTWIDDNTALLIELHDGIMTHHGTPYTSDDLAFSIQRIAQRGDYEGREDWTSGRAQFYKSAGDPEIIDELTVRLPLDPPSPAFPGSAFGVAYMVDKDYIQQVGDSEFSVKPSGFGPYRFVSRDPDTEIRSTRFDEYFWPNTSEYGPWVPWYKDLVQLVRPEPLSVVAALEAGEVDFAAELAPDLAGDFEDDEKFTVLYYSDGLGHAIQFNTTLQTTPDGNPNPFLDKRVRIAANLAVNKQAYIDSLLTGRETPMYGLSTRSLGFPFGEIEQYYWGYDLERAKALMKEAGYEDGFDVPLYLGTGYFPQSDEVVLVVQQDLAKIGIRTELRTMPFADYLPVIRDKSVWGLHYFGTSGTAEVQSNAQAFWADDGFYNQSPIPGSRVNELFEAQSKEFDPDRRKEILKEAWIEHYTQASWIFLHEVVRVSAYNNKKVRWLPDGGEDALPAAPAAWEFQVLKNA